MATQSEAELESELIQNLVGLGYTRAYIQDETALLNNLKKQLEKHNNLVFSNTEFEKILNHLNKGNVYERAKILRDKMELKRDDNTNVYISFFNLDNWCQNEFQVTNQITIQGIYKNRYDVTLLVNGLPLVQIELKKRGLELKEAFNQIERYKKHSYSANRGLFMYVQLFIISNGVNTKYFANNRVQNFKQTFYWADQDNQIISNIKDFTNKFLNTCHIAKMMSKYMILDTNKVIKVLRPYQYYAVENIIHHITNTDKNGYIWHTTGSGKTLTSFKASQLLVESQPDIYKVVFVVDRKDLDYQTIREFNQFQEGSVNGTDDTGKLVEQFANSNVKLIVTTIQKLNTAISKTKHSKTMQQLKNEKIIFIFDECHRSQFGDTHKRIKAYFDHHQMIGFTGTPIFVENAYRDDSGRHTTKELFGNCLHKYVITDAIRDENVLRFAVEYVGKYTQKESKNLIDIQVEDINKEEIWQSPDRINKISNYIVENYKRKTQEGRFNAMFCLDSVQTLIKYYDKFQELKEQGLLPKDKDGKDLKIATIFSYGTNEDSNDLHDGYDNQPQENVAEPQTTYQSTHTRDKLGNYIADYNKIFGTNYNIKESQSFYEYYKDVSKRIKNKEIDLVLVVNMFLTGFDSPLLNTLFVEKNLKYHGLIQAFSRTNRIFDQTKSQGNIVCFRNLKNNTDDAITLFSNKEAIDVIIMKPYEYYVEKFNEALAKLKEITPNVESVDTLQSEEEEAEFVQTFREILRQYNILRSFADFDIATLGIDEQEFVDYRTKYLDIYDKVNKRTEKEKISILNDIDFEVELLLRDDITVSYILKLLAKLKNLQTEEAQKQKEAIISQITSQVHLRSKKELIEKFINQNLMGIEDTDRIEEEFSSFWEFEKQKSYEELYTQENLSVDKLRVIVSKYLYDNKTPLDHEIMEMLQKPPRILERGSTAERIKRKIAEFVEIFLTNINV